MNWEEETLAPLVSRVLAKEEGTGWGQEEIPDRLDSRVKTEGVTSELEEILDRSDSLARMDSLVRMEGLMWVLVETLGRKVDSPAKMEASWEEGAISEWEETLAWRVAILTSSLELVAARETITGKPQATQETTAKVHMEPVAPWVLGLSPCKEEGMASLLLKARSSLVVIWEK